MDARAVEARVVGARVAVAMVVNLRWKWGGTGGSDGDAAQLQGMRFGPFGTNANSALLGADDAWNTTTPLKKTMLSADFRPKLGAAYSYSRRPVAAAHHRRS